MSTARGLRNKIVPASLEIALVQARKPERLAKYAHRGERERGLLAMGYRIGREVLRSKAIRES